MVIVPELPGCRFNPPRTSFCGWRTGTAPSSACRHHQTSPVLRWSRLSMGASPSMLDQSSVAEVPIWTHLQDEADASAVGPA